LDKVSVAQEELGPLCSLSPEYWLSFLSAQDAEGGIPLEEIVSLYKKTRSSIGENTLVLDTGNSDRGLFILPSSDGSRPQRTSNKKVVPEGSVLISRLRPYLKQVVYVPYGICELLGVDSILCSTEYYVLESKDSGSSIAYLVPWLLSSKVQSIFDQATTGGHHPRFNEELLLRLSVPKNIYDTSASTSKRVDSLVAQHLHAQLEMSKIIVQA
jgi:hypothetical protein